MQATIARLYVKLLDLIDNISIKNINYQRVSVSPRNGYQLNYRSFYYQSIDVNSISKEKNGSTVILCETAC
jgi:hypothetical protein